MTYSSKNKAWDRLNKRTHDDRIQDEAFLANQIQAQTGCKRSEALKEAARIISKDEK